MFEFDLIKVYDILLASAIRLVDAFPGYPIRACSLKEPTSGQKHGRHDESQITALGSTGVAIQDIACARLVSRKTLGKAGYLRLDFVDA